MRRRAEELIATLGLEPHPEGGFYRELFRSGTRVAPSDGRGPRAALTTIFFLLTSDGPSRWHRVRSDEVWHLYEGGPLELFDANLESRSLRRHRLGRVGDADACPVYTVPAGHWQAARSLGDYTLVGCTVGPGFEYSDFRMLAGDPGETAFRAAWPELAWLI